MRLSTETYTRLIRNLQDLNQEIRLRLLSMPYYTAQEMLNLEQWLEEVEEQAKNLENLSSVIYQHSQLLRTEFQMRQQEVTSQDSTEGDS